MESLYEKPENLIHSLTFFKRLIFTRVVDMGARTWKTFQNPSPDFSPPRQQLSPAPPLPPNTYKLEVTGACSCKKMKFRIHQQYRLTLLPLVSSHHLYNCFMNVLNEQQAYLWHNG